MMHVLYFFLGTGFGLVVTSLLLVRRIDNLEAQNADTMGLVLAAEWLARYNYGYYAAMQDVVLRESGSNYHTLQGKVMKQLHATLQYGAMGQLIPLDRVPGNLRAAAQRYNRRVQLHWPLPYVQVLSERSEAEARIMQLQDAYAAVCMQNDKPFDDDLLRRVALRAGTSVVVVETCLLDMRAYVHSHADHILGIQNAEEVLPSLY